MLLLRLSIKIDKKWISIHRNCYLNKSTSIESLNNSNFRVISTPIMGLIGLLLFKILPVCISTRKLACIDFPLSWARIWCQNWNIVPERSIRKFNNVKLHKILLEPYGTLRYTLRYFKFLQCSTVTERIEYL